MGINPDGMTMLALVCGIVIVASLAHGTIGFGFPLIATPTVALFLDLRTAILVTVLPNLVVNLISIVRGGNWKNSLAKHWPLAVYVVAGSWAGTRLLIYVNPEPLKLLLAAMILVYLGLDTFKKLDWPWLKQHQKLGDAVFGTAAGLLSGTVNVAVPPLVIYLSLIGLAPVAMSQVLNLCFFAGRSIQAATFAGAGMIDTRIMIQSAVLAVIATVALFAGYRLQGRVAPAVYTGIIRGFLMLMVVILVYQVVRHALGSTT